MRGRTSTLSKQAPIPESEVVIRSTTTANGSSLFVDGIVNGEPVRFLVDTGATRTIARPDMVTHKKPLATYLKLRTATGEKINTHGEVKVMVTIGGKTLEHQVILADVADEFILGMDLMRKIGLSLDLKHGVLRVGDEDLPLHSSNDSLAEVIVEEEVTIPGRSEIIVKGRLNDNRYCGQVRVIEPLEDIGLTCGVFVAKAVVRVTDFVPVRLMNVDSKPNKVESGTIIGRCESISSIVRNVSSSKKDISCGRVDELLSLILGSRKDLSSVELSEVRKLLENYCDVFAMGGTVHGRTNLITHKIDVGGARPIKQQPRRLPLAKREEAERIIQGMKNDAIIEPSSSPWMSPVVLVKKKDGSTRFCVDYRQLNHITKKDSYPLPRIDDTLDTLSGSKWFSTLDLKSGYWQVEMAPEDREKTAFSVGSGLWQFTVMPFGLCNAPATFERLMDTVLRGLSWKTCLIYLDDVIVMGKTFTEHLHNLEDIFRRLRSANLKLNPKKCRILGKEVKYLGHVVSPLGVAVDPEKVEAVLDWPVPKDKHELRSFLGLCTYYRRFVHGFANIAKPLTKLTEEGRKYSWDEGCNDAFEDLKRALTSAPILSYPNSTGKFILDTDASSTAIGGVLSQLQDGQERVIGYFSKTLSKPEKNYCVTRRELLGVVKSINHFYKYLYGQRFLLRTDHSALKWLLQFKSPEGQVARWIESLQEYDFDIEHRPGSTHKNADALSRRPCVQDCKHCSRIEEKDGEVRRTTVVDDLWDADGLKKDQCQDSDIGIILEWKLRGIRPTWNEISCYNTTVKAYWAQWDALQVKNGVLKRALESEDGTDGKLQVVVPKCRVHEVLRHLHDGSSGGHFGFKRTLQRTRERFYWVNCKKDVQEWCRKCSTCAIANQNRRKAPMRQYNVGSPFERMAIDIAGPFPVTAAGNRYILVTMDYFSKWVEAYAVPNQEASTIAEMLVKECFSRFGVPLEIHSDQGRNFESNVFKEVCQLMGVHKTRTTPLHPQSDGMVERMNRTMGKYLSKVVSEHQKDWDEYLHFFLMAYRSSVHETTNHSPACIIFGREMRLPCDLKFGCRPGERETVGDDYVGKLRKRMDAIHTSVRQHTRISSDRMKEQYDVRAQDGGYKLEDLVWLYNPKRRRGCSPKLERNWDGPYKVLKKISDVIYRIMKMPNGKRKIVHYNRLAPYLGQNHYGQNIVLGPNT